MVAEFGSTADKRAAAAARRALSPPWTITAAGAADGAATGGRRHVCRRHSPPAHTQETQPRVTGPCIRRLQRAGWHAQPLFPLAFWGATRIACLHGPLDPGKGRPGRFKAHSSRNKRTPQMGGGRPARLLASPLGARASRPPPACAAGVHTCVLGVAHPARGAPGGRASRPPPPFGAGVPPGSCVLLQAYPPARPGHVPARGGELRDGHAGAAGSNSWCGRGGEARAHPARQPRASAPPCVPGGPLSRAFHAARSSRPVPSPSNRPP